MQEVARNTPRPSRVMIPTLCQHRCVLSHDPVAPRHCTIPYFRHALFRKFAKKGASESILVMVTRSLTRGTSYDKDIRGRAEANAEASKREDSGCRALYGYIYQRTSRGVQTFTLKQKGSRGTHAAIRPPSNPLYRPFFPGMVM